MRVSASLPTGVAALFFDSARRRRRLEEAMVAQLERQGFSEVILPVVDYLEPYEAIAGSAGRDELYRFVDRDGEVLALRADFTPMLARLLAPRLPSLALPLDLFYRGDVLRYQEERAGRQRELYQLGAELLGHPGEVGERLALRRFLELLTAGERRRMLVVLGFAGALDGLLAELADTTRSDGGETAAAVVRRERWVARRGPPALLEVIEDGLPADPAALGPVAAERLGRLLELAGELGREFPQVELRVDLAEFADQTLDPRLAADALGARETSSRAYYDGLVFRAFGGAAAEPLGGGGRYDRLFARLGVEGLTASGFVLGLDRLVGRAAA